MFGKQTIFIVPDDRSFFRSTIPRIPTGIRYKLQTDSETVAVIRINEIGIRDR